MTLVVLAWVMVGVLLIYYYLGLIEGRIEGHIAE